MIVFSTMEEKPSTQIKESGFSYFADDMNYIW